MPLHGRRKRVEVSALTDELEFSELRYEGILHIHGPIVARNSGLGVAYEVSWSAARPRDSVESHRRRRNGSTTTWRGQPTRSSLGGSLRSAGAQAVGMVERLFSSDSATRRLPPRLA